MPKKPVIIHDLTYQAGGKTVKISATVAKAVLAERIKFHTSGRSAVKTWLLTEDRKLAAVFKFGRQLSVPWKQRAVAQIDEVIAASIAKFTVPPADELIAQTASAIKHHAVAAPEPSSEPISPASFKEAVIMLLASGDDTGCEDSVVVGLTEFLAVQKLLRQVDGVDYGNVDEPDEDGDTPYYCQSCDHKGTLDDFTPTDGNAAPLVCPECGLTNCFKDDEAIEDTPGDT